MIEIQNVTKKYGNYTALNNLNFKIEKGEIVGFLGPNGAGKSTTMNIITGYISATQGTVKVDGLDILENPKEVKKKIGYLPEIPPVYMDMTVEEYLDFVAKIKGVSSKEREEHISKVVKLTKVEKVRKRLIKNLSKGYRQRVGLAQAIMGDPEILILDEPTVGLDPKQIIDMRNLIKEIGKSHTVLLSSHILSEVSAVCSRIVIINKGHIVASGTPEELSKMLSYSDKLLIRVKADEKAAGKVISELDNVKSYSSEGSHEKGTFDFVIESEKDKDIRENVFSAFCNANYPILMMKNENLNLEDIFLKVTDEGTGR